MPTPADLSDTPQFTIMPLPDPSLRGCPMTDLNRLGHPTLRTSARLDSSDLPQSQRSVPMSVLTPPSHLRDPSSRNFTCPCSWLLRCHRLNSAICTYTFSDQGRSVLQLLWHAICLAWPRRPPRCLATNSSLTPHVPVLNCHS